MVEFFGPLTPALVLLMIVALVEFFKRLGLQGNWPMVASMVTGVVFGVLFQLAELYPTMGVWFQIVVYGLILGLAASGLYDVSKRVSGVK